MPYPPQYDSNFIFMINNTYHFELVTLLITHYNRSKSLERLLKNFQEMKCSFGEIIVSDDGSNQEHESHLKYIQPQYAFKLISSPSNKGLGNNINKGQQAAQKPYTLYIQEDFVPKPTFPEHFKDALQFLEEDKTLDTVRFYSYYKYPYTKPFGKGYSEMIFKKAVWYTNHLKFYYYSDHPHLRRSNFLDKFGLYPEGLNGDVTEFTMSLSFLKNNGRGLLYDDINGIIDQVNSPAEPSTFQRRKWGESKNIFILAIRCVYLKFRLLKNSLQLAKLR